jgi:hypothetical protein
MGRKKRHPRWPDQKLVRLRSRDSSQDCRGSSLQAGAAVTGSPRRGTCRGRCRDISLIIGVNTHLDTHTAALCAARGRQLSRRRAGKGDARDAVRAARELLARPWPAQMRSDGDRVALRLLRVDRDNAVASAKTARTALASVLVTAPVPLRERLLSPSLSLFQ